MARQAEKLRADGADVLTLPVDVRDSSALADGIARAGRHGPLAGAVHAAGVFEVGTVADVDEEAWDGLVDIKLKAG